MSLRSWVRCRAVDLVFDVLELGSSLYDLVRKLRRGPPPPPPEEPIPLTQRVVSPRHPTMRPPP